MTNWNELDSSMCAVDTARRYCEIEPEAAGEVVGSEPGDESWPAVGSVSFHDACAPGVTGDLCVVSAR